MSSGTPKGLPTAMETAEVLFNHVFRNFGIPEDIVSDRGPPFISRVWRSFFSLLGVTVSLSSGYHPQNNGQIERKIQEIGRYLLPQPPELLEPIHHLGRVCTELSPSVLYGSHPLLVRTLLQATSFPLVWRTFGRTISHSLVPGEREGLELSTSTSPVCSTTSQTSCGCQESHHSRLPPTTEGMALPLGYLTKTSLQKRSPRFIGPFAIICQVNPVMYELKLPSQYRIHPTFHVSLLKPYHSPVSLVSTEPGLLDEPPLPIVLEYGMVYSVNEILSSRRRGEFGGLGGVWPRGKIMGPKR